MGTEQPIEDPVRRSGNHNTPLDTVLRHAAAARSGRARAVLVRGPAGIGRSHLLSTACQRLRSTGVTVRTVAAKPDAPTAARAVDALLAPAPVPATETHRTPGAHQGTHDDWRRRQISALQLLAEGPLALVIDDAQWSDETSLRCLDFILRRAAGLPFFLLLAQRTDVEGPGVSPLAELLAQDRCSLVEPGPLGESETALMTAHFLGGPVEGSFVRQCVEISGGNPLLLGRLLAALNARGVRPDTEGTHRLGTLHESVLTSLIPDFLAVWPPSVRHVATALALVGRAATDPLVALSGVDSRRVEGALDVLRRSEIVLPGSPAEMRNGLREAVLAPLSEPGLQELRARAARVLSDAGRPATEVAAQLALLERIDRPWMLAVLRDAVAEEPNQATVRATGRVLRDEAHPLTDTERKDVHVELAAATARDAAAPALWHLRQALAATDDLREQASIAVQYGRTALGTNRTPEAVQILGQVLDALPDPAHITGTTGTTGTTDIAGTMVGARGAADRELRITVESALLITAVNDRSALPAARERAATLTPPSGHSPAERQLLAVLSAFTALDSGPADRAATLARRALRVEEPGSSDWTVPCSATVLTLADSIDEALEAFDRVLSPSPPHRTPWPSLFALAGRSLLLHGIGDVPGAARDARAALATTATAPPLAHIALADVLLSQGETRQAGKVLDQLANAVPALDQRVWEWPHYLHAKGRVLRDLGDAEGALELWQRCGRSLAEIDVTNPLVTTWWLSATTTLARLGRRSEAQDIAEQAHDRAQRWGTARALGLAKVAAANVAEGTARIDLLNEALDLLDASPARLQRAAAEYRLGRELLGRDDAPGARRHLRRAIELATRCGCSVLGARARTLLVTAGGRMPQLATAPLDSLTQSERRVAALAQRGASNKKIAETLFITPRTVEMHLTNVYRKLGVRGRAALPKGLTTTTGRTPARHQGDGMPAPSHR
ncbi:LuxR C-terminal-related transcriptional regulator [Streptomyces sp. NPDC059256]|uniref:helix-turn-helix transcriptional regulator n=1 Tax=Streptomyces sp. NPDC059256 TaxID=3346794 RepID=UPI00368A1BBD